MKKINGKKKKILTVTLAALTMAGVTALLVYSASVNAKITGQKMIQHPSASYDPLSWLCP